MIASERWRRLLVSGFEDNHNRETICLGLQLFIQKALGWRHNMPVFILGAGIKAAFDEQCLEPALERLEHWHFPGDLITALVEETLAQQAVGQICGISPKVFLSRDQLVRV